MQESVFQTILVGDNGTPESDRAIEVAKALARCLHAKLVLLGVISPPSPEMQAEGIAFDMPSSLRSRLEQKLALTVQDAREAGLEVQTEIVDGNPEKQLEEFAIKYAADLIVVGHRDISRMRRLLEGSTSEALVRRARVSVLVVHA
jgi:nucleotide-binding universal stress UspA family protein